MPGDINTDAQKTADDLKEVRQTHDLSKVFEDISKHSKDPNELKSFLSKVNEDMQKDHVLPSLELKGLDDKNVAFKDKRTGHVHEFNQKGQQVKDIPAAKAPDDTNQKHDKPLTGAHTETNAKGQVSDIHYANGKQQKFERDAHGDINKYTDKDGHTWQKGKDNTWHDTQHPEHKWKGKVTTDENANVIKEDAKGNKEIDRKDGSHLSLDSKGVLKSVTDGHGNTSSFKYDAGGKLSEIDRTDGTKVTTADGGKTFTVHDAKGDHQGTNLQVDKFGSVSYDKADAPGHRITEKNDGARLETDEKGRVVDVTTADRKHEFSFKYDGDKLVGVKNDFGNWTSKDGHEFVNEKGQHWAGKVNVDDKGNYNFVSDSGVKYDYRTDGSSYTPENARAQTDTPQQQNPGDRPVTTVQPHDGRGDQVQQRPDAPAPPPFEKAPDGSIIQQAPWGFHRQWQNGASVDYDKAGHTIGTNDGQGHTRQFHYGPDGQIDWIKGFDGSTWVRTGPREFRDNMGRGYMGDVQVDQKGVTHYQPDAMQDRNGRWHLHPPPFAQIPTFDPVTRGTRQERPGYQPDPPYRFGEYGRIVQPPPRQDVPQPPPRPQDVPQQRRTATPGDPPAPPAPPPADRTPTTDKPPQQKRTSSDHPEQHRKPANTDTPVDPNKDKKPTDTPVDHSKDKKPDQPVETKKPSDQTTQQPKPVDNQPTNTDNFKPEQGIYNPVGPPGMGESHTDESYTRKKSAGAGNIDIDERYVDHHITSPTDGSQQYDYHGKLADGTFSDTKFTGSEKFTKDGKLTERHVSYDSPKDLTVKDYAGAQKIEGVTSVDTTLNSTTGHYETTFNTKDGQIWKAETGSDGKVVSLHKVTGDKQTSTIGDTSTNASHYKAGMDDNYDRTKDQFSAVRPRGMGEMNPGQARDDNYQSTRTSIAEHNADNTTTYHYKGAANDGPWHWSNVGFDAQERVDASGNILSTDIKYDRPTDEKFVGPNGEAIQIANVTQAHSVRNADGSYASIVTDKNGKMYQFKTDANGKVLSYNTMELA